MSSLVRDRFGQRPLYYAVRDGRLIGDERASALATIAGLPLAIEPRAAAAALCGLLNPPDSLFRGIRQVTPGGRITLRDGAAEVNTTAAGAFDGSGTPEPATPSRLLAALRTAVSRMADNAACALSGGLDSSLVLALMGEDGSRARAYTLRTGFSDEAELRAARGVASRWSAEHVVVDVDENELPDRFPEAVRACETPLWNGAAVARLSFFRAVRLRGEGALLSGVGADELLCGNPAAMAAWAERLRAERQLAASLLTPEARSAVLAVEEDPRAAGGDIEATRAAFVRTLLPDSTLPPECRCSASAGIEARLPYLDDAFAAIALRLPAAACFSDGQGKQPLREAARGLVPDELRSARKTPRLAPSGGGSERARARWLERLSTWLRRERLEPLACVEPARARELFERFARRPASDPARADEDAVLLRLASLAILAGAP